MKSQTFNRKSILAIGNFFRSVRDSKTLERIFKNASEALQASWNRTKLLKKLLAGKVEFTFKKANGEIRKAIGTLNNQFFNYSPTSNSRKKENPLVIKYWDLEKNAFRSFRIDRLISF